ncbi:MAG: methionyl-tRNA formyltransferase [Candidatus Pacebacteria bacterium]|jgi:methionyl-tRNA formyltransferase|nr:methionyl-tRNA formyltransferase [Candidatus Paceibacterota bacterium]
MTKESRIAFWGTSHISVIVLDEMAREGMLPSLIVTAPPRQKGRGLEMSPSEVKVWADAHGVPALEPEEIKSEEFLKTLGANWDLFVIVSYGKIIPRNILDLPKNGTLNVHPSLLPKFRGASPIQSAILEEAPVGKPHDAGVTIMQIDEQVDHGPIVAQEKISISNWPPKGSVLEETLGALGAKILVKTIPEWIAGNITPREQNHDEATFTKKITKESGLVSLTNDPADTYRKVQAFDVWPRVYFMTERGERTVRVVITEAHVEGSVLVIDRVIPEGKKEMEYEAFLRGQK